MVEPSSEKHAWLMKSEPESYGISHLKKDKKTAWTGVRNFQARNFMQAMQVGDPILFYHSSCKVPGVYGLAKVASKPYADPTQFVKDSHYYDPRATTEKPTWFLVDIAFIKEFKEPVTLTDIRDMPKLRSMMILQRGSRLSVTPVDHAHFAIISTLAQ
jgi:predicted RNA-binding protein with PUA-like domain